MGNLQPAEMVASGAPLRSKCWFNESRGEQSMASDETQARHGFADLLAELTDSDLVIEVAAGAGVRQTPQLAPVEKLQDAVEASYRALAGTASVSLETVAV